MRQEDIPSEIFEGYIKKVSETRQIPIEKLISEYEKVLNRDSVKKWDAPDSEKVKVAGKILFKNWMSKDPITTYEMLIPIGMTEPRLKKDAENKIENMRVTIFVAGRLTKDKPFEIKEVVFNGRYVPMVQKIQVIRAYSNVKLYDKGFFIGVGDGTKFDNSQKLKMSEEDFITKVCKLPKLDKLSDVVTHKSKRQGETIYADKTDMYLIEGMVQRGFKKGYAIKDESLPYEEKLIKIGDKSVILPQTLTVWIPSRFYKWDEDSELAFLGTIDIGWNDKKPVMNAVLVYPVGYAELIQGKKEEKK
ncbi:MAG: hypothetical protein H8D45_28125 [Bacteroidetes bacterium]|nr:hypothetical protein [Bacteroidota bacterium]